MAIHYGKKRTLAPLTMKQPDPRTMERLKTPARGHNLDSILVYLDATLLSGWSVIITVAQAPRSMQVVLSYLAVRLTLHPLSLHLTKWKAGTGWVNAGGAAGMVAEGKYCDPIYSLLADRMSR